MRAKACYLLTAWLIALCWLPLPSVAQELPERAEAWLVTYGTGELYWQRFGHNAIWIRDAELGLDHVFNFGFFDFEQQNFLWNFLKGRLLYFSAAQPAQREFSQYIDANRSIRAQRLNLSALQLRRLTAFLANEVRPENRFYLYDYYVNNCSTRVRDALDMAFDGALAKDLKAIEAGQTWRDHTRRLSIDDFWLYLGLETGLGAAVDRQISRWDELFIPGELADAMADAVFGEGGELQPMVLEDALLFESTLGAPPVQPVNWWPRYLTLALGILLASYLVCRLIPPICAARLAQIWLVFGGIAGSALFFFWFFTDHSVARLNLNLMLLNPLWLLFAFPGKYSRAAGWALALISVMALLMFWLPPYQYNLDVIAALLPLNLAAAWVLMKRGAT
jgi:hypothetical protein